MFKKNDKKINNTNNGRAYGRPRKRRKRKLKTSFKIFLICLFTIVFIGCYGGYRYYQMKNAADPHGSVGRAKPTEKKDDSTYNVSDEVTKKASYQILDVGGGESIFIKVGDTEVLIDAGDAEHGQTVVNDIKGSVSGKLDYVILTNNQSGRIGGISAVYQNFKVGKTILGDMEGEEKSVKTAIGKNGKIIKAKNTTIDLSSDGSLSIFKPKVSSGEYTERSVMTVFTYGDTCFVSESDAGEEEETRLSGEVTDCDVDVLAKHGSADEGTNKLGDKLGARYLVASTSKDSMLPSRSLIENGNSNVFSTANSGTIKFESDGTSITASVDYDDALK